MSASTEITVDYGSHKYTDKWERSDLYCPACGVRRLWVAAGEGDYYVGAQYICLSCEATFHLQNYPEPSNDRFDKQRLEQLRDADSASVQQDGR